MTRHDALKACTECGKPAHARGLCGSHYQRATRAGSLPEPLPSSTGYYAIHSRLRKRGLASEQTCAAPGCVSQAAQWAWNRTGPTREGFHGGAQITWGTDDSTYIPLCHWHHNRLDHA